MVKSSFASRLALATTRSGLAIGGDHSIKVGFLAPLSGDVSSWGEPGLNGCHIWLDQIKAAGGISIDGQRHKVELVPFDCQYNPDLALAGARQLVLHDGVKFLMMLGGDTFTPVRDFLNQHKILTSSLLPSDLSPDTPYLIAPAEIHPIYNVTGVEWLAENRPHLKSVALCAQADSLGLPSIATYRAAFAASGISIVAEEFFPVEQADLRSIVARMMEKNPDILCWDTAYEPFVHELTEAAFKLGFTGQIISCTADNYPDLVARTSVEFMEGFIFQFPDFDDEMLNQAGGNLYRPNQFYAEYNRRYPGTWSAVSWEYASILDLWRAAVEVAGTVEPVSVLAQLKAGGQGSHAFGPARWWGAKLFGIDNALVGNWPVVEIRNGKACIAEFRSTIDWCERHFDLLEQHMRSLGQMWDQRLVSQGTDTATQPRRFFPQSTSARS